MKSNTPIGTFRCRRCRMRVTRARNRAIRDQAVVMPSGEPQATLLKGMNLLYQPLGKEGRRLIRNAYRGPGCRYHPEDWSDGESWGGETVCTYGCCWAFEKDMPGCRVGPHIEGD